MNSKSSLTCSMPSIQSTVNKLCFLLFAVFLLSTTNSSAQTGAGGDDCRIRYSYDEAGNRIRREYKCVSGPSGPYDDDPYKPNPGTILTVYPNPTTGVFHGSFSELVAEASFIIYAADGSVVQTYELMQSATTVSFDITAQVPGTYFLTVMALNQEETHTIIKNQ